MTSILFGSFCDMPPAKSVFPGSRTFIGTFLMPLTVFLLGIYKKILGHLGVSSLRKEQLQEAPAGAVKDTVENIPSHLRQINNVLSFPIRIGPGLIMIIGLG